MTDARSLIENLERVLATGSDAERSAMLSEITDRFTSVSRPDLFVREVPRLAAAAPDIARRRDAHVDEPTAGSDEAGRRIRALFEAGRLTEADLERFAADRAPIHFRPRADVGAALRRLQRAGKRIGVFTDAPRELAELALAHVGAARRVDVVGTRAHVLHELGPDAVVVESREQLATLD